MNFVDILIIVPLAYAAWKGFKRGFVIELFMLLALIIGIYAGIHFSDWTSGVIASGFNFNPNYLPVIAFTVTFLAVGAMVYFLGKVIERMLKAVNLSPLNKLFGVLFSTLRMLYIISVILILLETYDERGAFIPSKVKTESALYSPVKTTASATIPAIQESTIWVKNNVTNYIKEGPAKEDL